MTTVANALTVDVEDYFQVSAFDDCVQRAHWAQWPSRVVDNTNRLLDQFARHSVVGTFFVLGWVAEHHPHLVRRIAEAGHEIASHGYSHQLVYRQTPATFRRETARSRALLQDLSGQEVAGYRAASYSITGRSLWALDILAELGFRWDSSIFPIRHDRYGIADAPRWPHELTTPAGHRLIEFPLTTWQRGPLRLPVAGGGYFRLYPYAVTRNALADVNRREAQPFIFYLHPWEIDPAQPRIRAGALSRFRHYLNLARCGPRLDRLLDDFRFAPVGKVLAGLDLVTQARETPHAA